jgi:DNA-binding MarR family transcriptional regulator
MAEADLIKAFVDEVQRLAQLLKQSPHDRDTLPFGGRNIIEVLFHHGACTVPHIARIRTTSRQNVQIIINRLQLEGFVDLLPNPAHSRSPLVSATEAGIAALQKATRHHADSLRVIASVSEPQLLATTSVLRRIRGLIAGGNVEGNSHPAAAIQPKPVRKSDPGPTNRHTMAAAEAQTADEPEFPVNLL